MGKIICALFVCEGNRIRTSSEMELGTCRKKTSSQVHRGMYCFCRGLSKYWWMDGRGKGSKMVNHTRMVCVLNTYRFMPNVGTCPYIRRILDLIIVFNSKSWCCWFSILGPPYQRLFIEGDVLLSTMGNHHFSPSFGDLFFCPTTLSKSKLKLCHHNCQSTSGGLMLNDISIAYSRRVYMLT